VEPNGSIPAFEANRALAAIHAAQGDSVTAAKLGQRAEMILNEIEKRPSKLFGR